MIEAGKYINKTATADVSTADGTLLGFYVNSTSSGTLVLKEGGSGGTAITGTITPAVGWHRLPVMIKGGLHATIANTLNVTFVYAPIVTS